MYAEVSDADYVVCTQAIAGHAPSTRIQKNKSAVPMILLANFAILITIRPARERASKFAPLKRTKHEGITAVVSPTNNRCGSIALILAQWQRFK